MYAVTLIQTENIYYRPVPATLFIGKAIDLLFTVKFAKILQLIDGSVKILKENLKTFESFKTLLKFCSGNLASKYYKRLKYENDKKKL